MPFVPPPKNRTLDRLLSRRGAMSRKMAAQAIRAGRVTVDGRPARDPSAWFPETARVTVDGRPIGADAAPVVYAMNKPRGVVTTRTDERGRPAAFALLPNDAPWLVAVGRLDQASAGLLLWTNDTDLANRLTDPTHHVPRVYDVKVKPLLSDDHLAALGEGVPLDDGPTRPCAVTRLRDGPRSTWLRITLREGRTRQIRRMLAAVTGRREPVAYLIRKAFGPIELGERAPGDVRLLSPAEERALREACDARTRRSSDTTRTR